MTEATYKFEKELEESRKLLQEIYHCVKIKPPDFDTIMLSDNKDWKLDYRNYHYIYLWLPSMALTMSFGDYGSGMVPFQQWINLGMRPGTVIKTSGQSIPTPVHLTFTDKRL